MAACTHSLLAKMEPAVHFADLTGGSKRWVGRHLTHPNDQGFYRHRSAGHWTTVMRVKDV